MANLDECENKYVISYQFNVLLKQLSEQNVSQLRYFCQMVEKCGENENNPEYHHLSENINGYVGGGNGQKGVRTGIDCRLGNLLKEKKFCDLVERVYERTR